LTIALPKQLTEAAGNRSLAVFVGTGLSAVAGLPTWPGLLDKMVALAERECDLHDETAALLRAECQSGPKDRDLPGAFQVLQDCPHVGRGRIEQWLSSICRDAKCGPKESHRILASMRLPLITTNYDCLLEEGFSYHPPRPVVKTWMDITPVLQALRTGKPFVFKAHGCVDEPGGGGQPGSAILTTQDYDRLAAHEAYSEFLKVLFGGHTALFLGYGMGDPDIQAVLRQIRHLYQTSWQPIYMVTKESLSDELRNDYQINEIKVADWEEIPGLLRRLAPPRPSVKAAFWNKWPYNWDLIKKLDILRAELEIGKTTILIHGDERHVPDVMAGAVMLALSRQGYRQFHSVYIEDHLDWGEILEKAENTLDIRGATGTIEERQDALCEQLVQLTAGGPVVFGFLCDKRPPPHWRVWEFVVRLGNIPGVCSHLAMGAPALDTVSTWEQSKFIILQVDDYRWADLTEEDRANFPNEELERLLRKHPLTPSMVQSVGMLRTEAGRP